MARSSQTNDTFAITVAIIIIIVSILCLIYKHYTNKHKIRPEINTHSTQTEQVTQPSPVAIEEPIPRSGLQLWLDATDISTVSFVQNNPTKKTDVLMWHSKANNIKLMADLQSSIGRNPQRTICDSKYPQFQRAQNIFAQSIFFDFEHSSTFNKSFGIQTIISLHSFEKENAITHEQIHGCESKEFNNFYIFTSHKKTPFHGHSKRLFSNSALSQVRNGKIRLDMNNCDNNVTDVKQWEGGDVRMAILECTDIVYSANRIGADRKHHHFAGSIVELIVYNRVLDEREKKHIQMYLVNKYYRPYYQSLYTSLFSLFHDIEIVKQVLWCLIEGAILNTFDSSY